MINEELEMAKRQTLHFLSFRLRSIKEVRAFLGKKGHLPELVQKAIDELAEQNFLDDRGFAGWWAEARIKQGWGQVKIKNELKMKGVEEEIINSVVDRDWGKIINQMIDKQSAKFAGLHGRDQRSKMRQWLFGRGFTWSQIQRAFDDITING